METIEVLVQQDEQPLAQPPCPVCGGPLILLRDYYRCSHCRHSFCESCEGDVGDRE